MFDMGQRPGRPAQITAQAVKQGGVLVSHIYMLSHEQFFWGLNTLMSDLIIPSEFDYAHIMHLDVSVPKW